MATEVGRTRVAAFLAASARSETSAGRPRPPPAASAARRPPARPGRSGRRSRRACRSRRRSPGRAPPAPPAPGSPRAGSEATGPGRPAAGRALSSRASWRVDQPFGSMSWRKALRLLDRLQVLAQGVLDELDGQQFGRRRAARRRSRRRCSAARRAPRPATAARRRRSRSAPCPRPSGPGSAGAGPRVFSDSARRSRPSASNSSRGWSGSATIRSSRIWATSLLRTTPCSAPGRARRARSRRQARLAGEFEPRPHRLGDVPGDCAPELVHLAHGHAAPCWRVIPRVSASASRPRAPRPAPDRLGRGPLRLELGDRLALGDRLDEVDRLGDHRREDAGPVALAEHLLVEPVDRLAGVDHRDQVAEQVERRDSGRRRRGRRSRSRR